MLSIRARTGPLLQQRHAWLVTTETFKNWLNSVFLPHILSCTCEKVALLVDNASSHSNVYGIRAQVVVIPLPPNITSVHQPMDMVLISTWKQTYRRFLVQELVRDIESCAERRAFYQGRTYGMHGMAQGYDPHMFDAANLAKLSWDNMSKMTIARCWVTGFRKAVRKSNGNATRQLLIIEVFPRRS